VQNDKTPQVLVQRDYLTVRDNVLNEIYKELKASLPQELLLEVEYDSLLIPTIFVKSYKHRILWVKTYNTHASIDFTPDVTDYKEKDFVLDDLLMSPTEKWSLLETKPGQLVASCYDPNLEIQIIEAIAHTSTKLKLSKPIFKRKGYDLQS
jgi:hypothetical protein